jgi:hypothetical protein
MNVHDMYEVPILLNCLYFNEAFLMSLYVLQLDLSYKGLILLLANRLCRIKIIQHSLFFSSPHQNIL